MQYKLIIKPKYLKFLGLIYNSAQVIYPYIIIPQHLKKKLDNSDPQSLAILEHEKVHFQRMKESGVLKWYLKYFFNKSFRLNEEVIAYKKQFEILKKYNIDFNLNQYAKILSSWTYLKMTDEKEAKRLLENFNQD